MNTPTPAQALGEVLKLSEKANAGELEAVMADGSVPCVGMVVADDSGGKGFLVAEGWSLDDCKFAAASMNLARQHGQHFAGLEERCESLARSLQMSEELRATSEGNLIRAAERAEAAAARCAEMRAELQSASDEIASMSPNGYADGYVQRIAAFLAARG